MSNFGITKTIPAKESREAVMALYTGSRKDYEFHMAGSPSKLKVGDWVYTIHQHEIVGRLEVIGFTEGMVNPKSGRPRTLIHVRVPGQIAATPILRRGHQGTRYWDGDEWAE